MTPRHPGMRRLFIIGTSGFIGLHLAKLLLVEGFQVHGIEDCLGKKTIRNCFQM